MTHTTDRVSAASFEALFTEVAHWAGAGGGDGGVGGAGGGARAGGGGNGVGADELTTLSALRHRTPARVAAAAALVRDGRTVSLGRRLDTHASRDNPAPAVHVMTQVPDPLGAGAGACRQCRAGAGSGGESDLDGVRFAKDYVGVDYHNDTHSHLDALCHVAYRGVLFGGQSARTVTSYGAEYATVELLRDGLVGRGVLLDIPRSREIRWLEPGESVVPADLEAAEHDQRVRVDAGDILLVRTGHGRRLAELGPWDTVHSKAGLHPSTATFLAERRVTALGSDGNSDTAPSSTEGVDFPIHVLAINALGIHLLDYLQLEDLAATCAEVGRWEFLCVAAPLRIPGGTGSPVNPIAIF